MLPDSEPSTTRNSPQIERVAARAFRVPTSAPESDGTLQWDATTCVVVSLTSGNQIGLGYSYTDAAAAELVNRTLAPHLLGLDATTPEMCTLKLQREMRNLGRVGIGAHALSAADIALWDLKARLSDTSLVALWGPVRSGINAYASGGFTSYDEAALREQLRGWRAQGFEMAKIKVGREPDHDVGRVAIARDTLGDECRLFVDANGAYTRKQALYFADAFRELGVSWFEEPVTSDDLEGLRLLRDRAPGAMQIAAGEYGYHLYEFRRLLEAGAVDVLQADLTRCQGFTGMRKVAALCEAWNVPLSAHCAPSLSVIAGITLQPMIHVEYFHDHVRLEQELFHGAVRAREGTLTPDRHVAGHGLALAWAEAERRVTV